MKQAIYLIAFLFITDAHADVVAIDEGYRIDFTSLNSLGISEPSHSTFITLSYSSPPGATLESSQFELWLFEEIGQPVPDYTYTVDNQSSMGVMQLAGLFLDGSFSDHLWQDLDGSIVINLISGTVYLSSVDVMVRHGEESYRDSFLLPADPYPTNWPHGSTTNTTATLTMSPVPLPAAVWLFIGGLLGLVGFTSRSRKRLSFKQ